MDFIFNCATCQGPLIARSNLRGFVVQCAHCAGGVEIRSGKPVTEAVANALLDAPLPAVPAGQAVLRRVRPPSYHSSAGLARATPSLGRGVRISHAV